MVVPEVLRRVWNPRCTSLDLHTVNYGPFHQKSHYPDAIEWKALCVANLVIIPPKIGGPDILVVHRVVHLELWRRSNRSQCV